MLTFGSLFAGIGGMDLGLERAGMDCSWQVEIDPFARRVLAKHWPDVRRHDDVRTFPPGDPDDWRVDLICGGFPCQDISLAGGGAGLDGKRSGLWFEYARVIRELRPRYVLVENVPGLLVRGLDRVLGTLAEIGYDAEWSCIPAAAVGAPHIRDRVFILAHAQCGRRMGPHDDQREHVETGRGGRLHQDDDGIAGQASGQPGILANPGGIGLQGIIKDGTTPTPIKRIRDQISELNGFGCPTMHIGNAPQPPGKHWWSTEPAMGRVAHGVPGRVDRLRGLGNAVVPQVAEWIGRLILGSLAS